MKFPAFLDKKAVISASVAALVAAVTPLAPAADEPENAESTYNQMCAGCHGTYGNGQEGTKSGFVPRVPTLANKEYMASVPDDYLFMVIKKGGEYMGKIATMPAWEKRLTDEQIRGLVKHIRTF